MRGFQLTFLTAVVVALAACSGGYEPPPAAGPGPNPPTPGVGGTGQPSLVSCSNVARPDFGPGPGLPGGIWKGVVSLQPKDTTREVQGVVTDDGRYWFSSDHDHWVGSFAASGTSFSGTGIAHSGGATWGDGSLETSVDMLGVFAERETLVADWSMGSGDWGCFDVDYDAELYERPSSLADVAGTWETSDSWSLLWRLTVDAQGNFSMQSPYDCDFTGRIGIIDERFALYEVQDAGYACRPEESRFSGFAFTYRSAYATGAHDDIIVLRVHNGSEAWGIPFGYSQP